MHASMFTQLLLTLCCFLPFAACVTKRSAKVQVHNNTPHSMSGVGVNHMYSDVYKETHTWQTIPAGGYSDTFTVNYNTGFGTTGRDWWTISGHNDDDPISHNSMSLWYSNPNNFRDIIDFLESVGPKLISVALKAAKIAQPQLAPAATVANIVSKALCSAMLNEAKTDGFKQHILRSEDEDKITLIRINNDGTINIISPSGRSDTVYDTKIQNFGL
jgi:hypothetical protein